MQESLDAMLNPALIGDMTLHAIQENEFYSFSHPEFKEAYTGKAQMISDAFDRWAAFREAYDH